ncbi:DNA-directed DNA polymerase I [Infirmifilum sp. NZ]|uniref:DNA-directed DNA polymerase I n=1 Tax=Infirmifilum sp. NZ TaxID=2926850 RepID=UPI00279BCB0B|nr:DNA-directed DNA polymerase I [Infirmifilum sp. NZ]UNQ74250.1 DNA-directed DNA polymerase I [Infirmifilum sp. NZ]
MTSVLYLFSVRYSGPDGKAVMYFYDDETGTLKAVPDYSGHKPYLLTDYTPEELIEKFPEVLRHPGFNKIEVVEKYDALNDRWVIMTKVEALDPLSIGGSSKSIREVLKGHAWEAKIKYHHCYIYDKHLIPGMPYTLTNGEPKLAEVEVPQGIRELVKTLSEDKVQETEMLEWAKLLNAPIPKIRRIAIDIEVESEALRVPSPKLAEDRVIAVSFYSSDGRKGVFLLKRRNMNAREAPKIPNADVRFFEDEKDLLQAVFSLLDSYPVVLTFNGDNFDLPYLYNRALKLGFRKENIPIVWSEKSEYADLRNSIHIDLYKFFTNKSMKVYAFGNKYREGQTLDEIASALIGKGKVKHEDLISEMSYERLAEYSFRDAELTYELTAFNDDLVMKLIILMMRISKLPMEDLTRHNISAWIRNMFYFEHRQRGWLIPNPEEIVQLKGETSTRAIIKGKKYLGAIVIDPIPGVYFNVLVVDFASLYPSVIKTGNLSYETVRCPHEECKKNIIPGTTHWVCTRKRGMMSSLIGVLRDLRVYVYKKVAKESKDSAEKQQYEVIQSALKVFLNASYGVFGSEAFPLYCPPVAEGTTALGRYAILKTMRKAVDLGIPVLYGDTDSLFLWNPSREQLDKLLQSVLDELKIDLSIDKEYKWVVFSERKKNYLGALKDGKVDVKGLVGKKRNTPDFVKNLFTEITSLLSKAENITSFEESIEKVREIIRQAIKELKSGEVPLDQLAFNVVLTKDIQEYNKTTPQHKKAAQQLLSEYRKLYGSVPVNITRGSIVSYVKTRDKHGVKHLQLARIDEVDTEKYLEVMKTTLEQVLDALEISFDELLGVSSIDEFLKIKQ